MWQLGRPKTQKVYHINLLKKWADRDALFVTTDPESAEFGQKCQDRTSEDLSGMGQV